MLSKYASLPAGRMHVVKPRMRKGKCVPLWHALVLSPRHSPQEAPQEVVVEGAPPLLAQPKTKDMFSFVICNNVPSQS